ncbi:MAG: ATP-dependent helicase [Deinococcales bacterium]
MSNLLSTLNEAQRAAAQHLHGPALVVAGAGAGKTSTVVRRIAYLIEAHGVYPNEILAVTFTNKAAGELKERVNHLVGKHAETIWVTTFHSAGVRILRSYGELVGLKNGFVIYDDADQMDVLKSVLEGITGAGGFHPRYLRGIIDRAKSNLWTPQDLALHGEEYISGMPKEVAVEGFRRYESAMRRANAIDFGDLLVMTVKLFREREDVLERIQNRAVFSHVDEYQDTNRAQYEMTRLLAEKYRNLIVIGDPDQSIYAFRGADIQNILDFQSDYPDAAIYRLEQNYRSNARVLEIANALIKHNAERLEKNLIAVKPAGEPVRFFRAPDSRAEAEFVTTRIEALRGQGVSYNDIAILYRTNAQSRVLEERMMRSGIPSKIVGGMSFYDRQEVKDLLAYARVAVNTLDDLALKRALKRPRRGVGDASLEKLELWAKSSNSSLLTALLQADQILERGGNKCEEFGKLILELSEYSSAHSAEEFFRLLIDVTGYKAMLESELKTNKFETETRLENIQELVNAAAEWDSENHGTVLEFLDDSALLASVDDMRTKRNNKNTPEDAVTMMTLHNAKGLEFDNVFLVGFEDGLLPHRTSLTEAGGLEEERRLLYVGITRAKERLWLTMADSRQVYGKTMPSEQSRFFADIPADLLTQVNLFNEPYGARIDPKRTPPVLQQKLEAAGAAVLVLRGGERVRHPKFGAGQVLAVMGTDDRQEAMIQFEVGAKKLLVKYANLLLEG